MVTHIAGPALKLGKLFVQRCCVCGEPIIILDLSRVMVPEGDSREPSCFVMGQFVEVEKNGGCTRTSVNGELPERFEMCDLPATLCHELVEV